jgi:hypothetical protein
VVVCRDLSGGDELGVIAAGGGIVTIGVLRPVVALFTVPRGGLVDIGQGYGARRLAQLV